MQNVLFYKFVQLDDLEKLKQSLQAIMIDSEVKGKILIATEGMNGNISGAEQACTKFIDQLVLMKEFSDIEFKITPTTKHDFKKTVVRIRPEIITLRHDWKLSDGAEYIEPEELKELYESEKEFYIIDTRNDYESHIGHFEDAIKPNIKFFSEFPESLDEMEHLKDKLVVTYCTGGIRCEKASAVMKAKGFTNVRQLHGGIIRYGEVIGNEHWKGKCFVFDERVAIDIAQENEPITACSLTGKPTAHYTNCKNPECDKRFLCGEDGKSVHDGCCSQKCQESIL